MTTKYESTVESSARERARYISEGRISDRKPGQGTFVSGAALSADELYARGYHDAARAKREREAEYNLWR